jgi:hypothetical protein
MEQFQALELVFDAKCKKRVITAAEPRETNVDR